MDLLLTGASGFVGQALLRSIDMHDDFSCIAVVRKSLCFDTRARIVELSFDSGSDWSALLFEGQVIIHVAGLAHEKIDGTAPAELQFREYNVDSTLNLARQASVAGVKRFIFISSIGVNGEFTNESFTEQDKACPNSLYAESKFQAEEGLREIQNHTKMEVVIIRPPLIYGRKAPGSFERLVNLTALGLPLPLSAIANRRSFICIENLVDFIITCVHHPKASNELFLIADDEVISTPEFIMLIANGLNVSVSMFWFPKALLSAFGSVLGKRALIDKLTGSLTIDSSKAKSLLAWTPPISLECGIKRSLRPHENK